MEILWQYNVGMADQAIRRKYDQPLQVRVTLNQLTLFRRAAESDDRSLSNWVRDRLQKAARKELGRH